MIRNGVYPLVQRRIKFCHDTLFPLRTTIDSLVFGNRVLRIQVRLAGGSIREGTYECAESKRLNVEEFEVTNEEGYTRRLVLRLLES